MAEDATPSTPSTPSPPSASAPVFEPEVRERSRTTAGILGVTLGFTGAHHYYLGSTMAGLLTMCTSCCGVGIVVGMVEGVLLLVMSDEEFAAKYVNRSPDPLEFVFQERY